MEKELSEEKHEAEAPEDQSVAALEEEIQASDDTGEKDEG